jgi:hypothetical protein
MPAIAGQLEALEALLVGHRQARRLLQVGQGGSEITQAAVRHHRRDQGFEKIRTRLGLREPQHGRAGFTGFRKPARIQQMQRPVSPGGG